MPARSTPMKLAVDGYEVSLTFAEQSNPAALGQVKQILLSSFVAHAPTVKARSILAIFPQQRDNIDKGKTCVDLDNLIKDAF